MPADKSILVLGVGNILRTDEGIGIEVIKELQKLDLPTNVRLEDGGTGGIDLVGELSSADAVVVVDAVDARSEPGSVFRFTPDDVGFPERDVMLSLHDIGLMDAVSLTRFSGKEPEVVIIGIQPESLDWGLELTATILAKKQKLVELVLEELDRLCMNSD